MPRNWALRFVGLKRKIRRRLNSLSHLSSWLGFSSKPALTVDVAMPSADAHQTARRNFQGQILTKRSSSPVVC